MAGGINSRVQVMERVERKVTQDVAEAGHTHAFRSLLDEGPDRPGQPGQPLAANITADTVQLTWEAADDNGAVISRYTVQWRSSEQEEWLDSKTAKGCSITLTNLDLANNSYLFRVQACIPRCISLYLAECVLRAGSEFAWCW